MVQFSTQIRITINIHRSVPSPRFRSRSEQQFQRELNKPRVCSLSRAGDHSKVRVVRRATVGRGRGKLGSVEEVKKFGPKLETQPFVGPESCSLEQGEVKIVDALRT